MPELPNLTIRKEMDPIAFKALIESKQGYKPYWNRYKGLLMEFLRDTPQEEWTKSFHVYEAWFDDKGLSQIRDISPAFFFDIAHHNSFGVQDYSLVFVTIPGAEPFELKEAE